jgi:Cu(I)/Ag(I) efflux system membrane fusion protein
MKTKSFFFSLLFAATAFALFSNCSGNKKEDSDTTSHDDHAGLTEEGAGTAASEPQFQVDENFQQQLGNVFTSYVSLKEAFISSDAEKVKAEASGTSQTVDKVDMKLLTGAAHNDWMTYLTPMQNSLKEIRASADIEVQRKAFSTLSDNLYKSIKAFGLGGKEAFYEYCPMAFNNEGAYWLSDQDKIRNPYFGDKMLTCGEVKEKLR